MNRYVVGVEDGIYIEGGTENSFLVGGSIFFYILNQFIILNESIWDSIDQGIERGGD